MGNMKANRVKRAIHKIKNILYMKKNKIYNVFIDILGKITRKNDYKLYLYFRGIKIKRIYVNQNENILAEDKKYVLNIYNNKKMFGKNKIKIIVKPAYLLLVDNKKREIHIEVEFVKGAKI